MNFARLIRGIAPIAAIALAAGLAGCKDMNITLGDSEGVPLAELDTSGDPPTELVLAAPDSVVVTDGDTLTIDVEGDRDAVEVMRFTLEDGTLGIMREKNSRADGRATVRVTMPSPRAIVIAGSGGVAAQSLASEAEVTIAGSGRLDVANIRADKLDVNVMGSGTFGAAGTAKTLDLTVAGAGSMEAAGLKVDSADISIMGSGNADFASDGKVEASVMGSGDVTITGNASCTVNSMGSGTVTCRATRTAGDEGPPEAPDAPDAPEPPAAP